MTQFESLCDYKVVKPEPLFINKKIVSSSLIRNYLQKGDLKSDKILVENGQYKEKFKRKTIGKKLDFLQRI